MPDSDEMRTTQRDAPPNGGGIGFGFFLLLAGLALLAEKFGWLPSGTDWLFPVILIAWGAAELYQRLRQR